MKTESKRAAPWGPPFLLALGLFVGGVPLEKSGSHDDKGQDDQNNNDFRCVHEIVIEAQMRMRLLVKIVGVHVIRLPRHVSDPSLVMA
jgi:hypothetical protein